MKMLNSIGNYLSNIGNKSGRSDIWVLCISTAFLACVSGIIPCVHNELTMVIIVGMFSDLGIDKITDTVRVIKGNKDERKEH